MSERFAGGHRSCQERKDLHDANTAEVTKTIIYFVPLTVCLKNEVFIYEKDCSRVYKHIIF